MKQSYFARLKQWVIESIARKLPSCKDVTETASHAMDTRLSLLERLRFRLHLLICEACIRYYKQIVFMRKNVQGLKDGPDIPDVTLPENAKIRMKRMLSEEQHS